MANIALLTAHAFVPYPLELVAIANGRGIGLCRGLFLSGTGSMLGAVLSYALARLTGDFVQQRLLNERQRALLDNWRGRHETRTLLAVRLVPLIYLQRGELPRRSGRRTLLALFMNDRLGDPVRGHPGRRGGAGAVSQGGIPAWIGSHDRAGLVAFRTGTVAISATAPRAARPRINCTSHTSFGKAVIRPAARFGADLVAATVIQLNTKYYGWAYAAYLSGLLYVFMVAAGVTVHWMFAAFGAISQARPESLANMMSFGITTHTFWLNVVFVPIAAILLFIRWRSRNQ